MINCPYYVDQVDQDIPDPDLWEPFGWGTPQGGPRGSCGPVSRA